MRALLNPRWLILINTLPLFVLFWLYLGMYQVIHTRLDEMHIQYWVIFGGVLAALGIGTLGYAIFCIARKQSLSKWFAIAALITYIPFLYIYFQYASDIIPWSIPDWMLTVQDLPLYTGTFIMPTLAYAVFVMVVALTREAQKHKAWLNLLITAGIPLLWYLFFTIVQPMWSYSYSRTYEHVMAVLTISSTVIFLFFFARTIYILTQKQSEFLKRYSLLWKIPILVVCPLLGLMLNNGDLAQDRYLQFIFGDFMATSFYVLAVITGGLLCIPNVNRFFPRLVLFILRSFTFTFTLYFFLVFLPYLPLSVFAIIAVGVGFLMLSPVALFLVHTKALVTDFKFLVQRVNKRIVAVLFLISLMVIPIAIISDYRAEKTALHQALDFVYAPDLSNTEPTTIDTTALHGVLNYIAKNKVQRWGNNNNTPYLTPLYNWLVLDNMMLSDRKINTLSCIYTGSADFEVWDNWRGNISNEVYIDTTLTTSHYNAAEQYWTSTIDLTLLNEGNQQGEYETTFSLPEGSWISNYYLVIEGEKVPGILAEKKAATWIYDQITSYRRDPGILHYLEGNEVAFKVFPCEPKVARTTGLEIIHKEPFHLQLDSFQVFLGDTVHQPTTSEPMWASNKGVAYLPAALKATLPKVQRTPYYHFVVDCSVNGYPADSSIWQIESLLQQNLLTSENARVTFANSYSHTQPLTGEWKNELKNYPIQGGFFLEKALREIYFHHYQSNESTFPIVVVITPAMWEAIFNKGLADFQITFPESDIYYHANGKQLTPYHLSKPQLPINDSLQQNTIQAITKLEVLAWPSVNEPKAYVTNNHEGSIVLASSDLDFETIALEKKTWQSGLALQGYWLSHQLHPEQTDKEWLCLVKHSFEAQLMSPVTSFISLEDEAQRQVLTNKQQQVLAGKSSLDIEEESTRMTEPGLIVLALIALFLIYYKRIITFIQRKWQQL